MDSYDLRIDKSALDEMLVQQPELFLKVAQELAQAISVRDTLKERVDVVRATSELRIRQEMADAGDKVTEALIRARLEVDEKYRRAVDRYLEARSAAAELEALKEAFQQRAWAIKDLCSLYIAGYFSERSVSGKSAITVSENAYADRRAVMGKHRRERL